MSIAGSDCSGGAGIQADLKTISALGAYAATAITAITVQNTTGVRAIHPVPPVFVRGQIEAVMDDIRPDAIKIGMINDIEIVKVISACLHKYRPAYVIFDPVMVSTSGHKLIEDDAIAALTDDLMPLTSLITPNLREAEVLTDHPINNVEEMKSAALELLKFGCKAVLLKGGHLEGGLMCDVLQIAGESTPHLFTSTKNRESEHPRNRLYPLFRHRHIPSFGLCDAASSGTCQTLRHPWHRGRERYPHR